MTLPTERLDDPEIERLIFLLKVKQAEVSNAVRLTDEWKAKRLERDKAADDLRSRIRTLIEEARKEGVLAEEIYLNGNTRGISL